MSDITDTATPAPAISFTPVPVRARHDGWTPGKQVAFIYALAETACVDEACRRVGMSQQSAYALRTRHDAVSFRQAWAVALDHGTCRLTDRAMARAMNGVPVPIFYKGEKVGERRVFNERLTMFLLRMHAPERYGAWRDRTIQTREHPDGLAVVFGEAVRAVAEDAVADAAGHARPRRDLIRSATLTDDESARRASHAAIRARYEQLLDEQEQEIEALTGQLRTRRDPDRADDGGSRWPTSDRAGEGG